MLVDTEQITGQIAGHSGQASLLIICIGHRSVRLVSILYYCFIVQTIKRFPVYCDHYFNCKKSCLVIILTLFLLHRLPMTVTRKLGACPGSIQLIQAIDSTDQSS